MKKQPNEFGRGKVFPLKGILAVLIVLHHLTYEIKSPLLQPFHSWGAPIVSVFFFISGYGLMTSYKNKGKHYLSGFIKHGYNGFLTDSTPMGIKDTINEIKQIKSPETIIKNALCTSSDMTSTKMAKNYLNIIQNILF